MVRPKLKKVVVLGMGNLLLQDEGIGVHVAHAIVAAPSPDDVELEVVDSGTLPDTIPNEGVNKLIVVDAVRAGGEPGAVYRFHPEDIEPENRYFTSLHQLNLLDNLWLMERFGKRPKETVIIGIEPEDIGWGLELSAKLKQCLPQVISTIMEEINS